VNPREILVLTQDGTFRRDDYPWAVAIRVISKGGDADGGEDGYVLIELYDQEPDPQPGLWVRSQA
jgi:hypothetical protein